MGAFSFGFVLSVRVTQAKLTSDHYHHWHHILVNLLRWPSNALIKRQFGVAHIKWASALDRVKFVTDRRTNQACRVILGVG